MQFQYTGRCVGKLELTQLEESHQSHPATFNADPRRRDVGLDSLDGGQSHANQEDAALEDD